MLEVRCAMLNVMCLVLGLWLGQTGAAAEPVVIEGVPQVCWPANQRIARWAESRSMVLVIFIFSCLLW